MAIEFVPLANPSSHDFNFLIFNKFSNLLDQTSLVHLVRNFGNDDGFFTVFLCFDFRF